MIKIDMSDLMLGRKDIQKLVDDTTLEVTKKITLDVGANLIKASPVDTGEFRGKWEIKTPDKAFDSGEVSNPTVYGPQLAGGRSKQAPEGWVENAIEAAVLHGGS